MCIYEYGKGTRVNTSLNRYLAVPSHCQYYTKGRYEKYKPDIVDNTSIPLRLYKLTTALEIEVNDLYYYYIF